jgi:hypothetical protein
VPFARLCRRFGRRLRREELPVAAARRPNLRLPLREGFLEKREKWGTRRVGWKKIKIRVKININVRGSGQECPLYTRKCPGFLRMPGTVFLL